MIKIKSQQALEYLHGTSNEKEFLNMADLLPLCDAIKAVIIAEQEAEERHTKQLQELKNIIVDVRIETCSHRNGKICFVDMERCRGVECLKIKTFSNKLSQKLTEKQ